MKEKFIQFGLWLLSADRRILGAILGCVLGLIYLLVGFWKTIVFLGFVLLGYTVGRMVENHEDWRDVIERLRSHKSKD